MAPTCLRGGLSGITAAFSALICTGIHGEVPADRLGQGVLESAVPDHPELACRRYLRMVGKVPPQPHARIRPNRRTDHEGCTILRWPGYAHAGYRYNRA